MNLKQLLTNLNPFKKQEPLILEPIIKEDKSLSEVSKKGYSIGRVDKNGNEIYTDKYTEEQKLFIVNCIGHCMSPAEIGEAFFEEYKMKLTKPSSLVGTYKRTAKWKSMIDKIRTEYLADINAVAGSHRRVRLERAERIYDRAVKKKDLHYQAVSIEQQRKEFDKHEYNQINILQQQYIHMSDEELSQRKKWLIDKLKLVKEVSNGNGRIEGEVGKSGKD